MEDQSRITLVDVGGAGGLQAVWQERRDLISPIVFEPNPVEAARLRPTIEAIPGGRVIEKALAHVAGTFQLNVTNFWGCTSMLEPDMEVLADYWIRGGFEVVDRVPIECVRYDQLVQTGEAPSPDVVKIDVQGFEYQVLLGFGNELSNCLGIELETHIYPIYQGQKLMHDLVDLLKNFGFVLRRIEPVDNFGGDVVELNAWFTSSKRKSKAFSDLQKRKFDTLRHVWSLSDA